MDKERIVWLARSRVFHEEQYAIFKNEKMAMKWADGNYVLFSEGKIMSFCYREFERITGVVLAAGEYCPIQINIKNMI